MHGVSPFYKVMGWTFLRRIPVISVKKIPIRPDDVKLFVCLCSCLIETEYVIRAYPLTGSALWCISPDLTEEAPVREWMREQPGTDSMKKPNQGC
jgi:hypothetical protein